MLKNQTELKEHITKHWRRYKDLMPHITKAYENLPNQVYKDGAIDGKTKRLIAMTAATVHGCKACILYQADEALRLGATVNEVLECVGIAVSLGGTMAEGESSRLIKLLEEKGLI